MAIGEPSGAPSQRAEEQEPIYEGEPGRTRLKPIHVPLPNGFVRTLQVYDAVNVGTDPHLREPTLAGALHRFDTGEVLAIPFVFHDPHARKLALVVPEVLRHEELRLRSKLLAELADGADAAVPRYVAEATTVVGVAGLAAYLERPADAGAGELAIREAATKQAAAQLEARAHDLEVQVDALSQRESRLTTRAEQVTRREDELRELAEELDAARADLAMRETELEARLETLVQREDELAQQRVEPAPLAAAAVELVDPAAVEAVVDGDDVEDLEPLETSPGQTPGADLAAEVELVAEPALDPEEDVEEIVDDIIDDEVAEVVDEVVEDVEELVEVEELPDEVTGVHADAGELAASKTRVSAEVSAMPRSEPPPPPPSAAPGAPSEPPPAARPKSVPPPPPAAASAPPPPSSVVPAERHPTFPPPRGFLESRLGANATAAMHDGGVRVFGRVPEGREADLFVDAPPELLVQLVVVEECPIVLLSVAEDTKGRPVVLRAPLDPRGSGKKLLAALAERYRAKVELFAPDGTYLRGLEVEAPREGNVARIRERVAKMRTAAAVDVGTAIDRVLSAPPPVRAKKLPFSGEPLPDGASAAEVREALDELQRWATHDKLDHARLVLSVPEAQVEATIRDRVERAAQTGLALDGLLAQQAVALGVAPDEATLVTQQLAAFRALTESGDHRGLDDEQLAEGWERLLKAAADNEVAVDTDTHEVAWATIRRVRGGDAGPSGVDPDKLGEIGAPQLVLLLEHPRHRRDAAIELARRKETELADKLCKAVRKMPRAEVVRVVPQIVTMGEAVGDALIDGLGARKTFVRQAFALGLGHLRLRRSVVPLLHLLTSEESEVWREIARVVGSFGTAGLRTVTRQLKDPKGLEERYVLTLAHLAHHGCEKQVKALTNDERPSVVTMATEALAKRAEAKALDARIRGTEPLGGDDGVAAFSHRFYAELEGRAGGEEA